MIDYKTYKFTRKELFLELIRGSLLLAGIGWLFFDSLIGILLLLPMNLLLLKGRRERKKKERILHLREDFREFLLSFTSSVQAGYTVEQSVLIGGKDLRKLYGNRKRPLLEELDWMENQIRFRVPPDSLFADLAKRSGLEEIRSFSVVLGVGKKQGGNLVALIRRTTEQLNKKMQVQLEVEQTIAGRVMEKNIMVAMPYGMLLYLRVTNGAYMEVLFEQIYGNLIMAACLAALYLAGRWADRIMDIRI